MEINPAKRAGNVLRMLREDSGKTQADLAREAQSSATMISYLENGEKAATGDLITRIGRALGHERALAEIWGFTTTSGFTTTKEILATYEIEAAKIHAWENRVVPGLLQTPDYARAVIQAARPRDARDLIDKDADERIDRQEVLSGGRLLAAWFILDESVLLRPFGGKEVMHGQLLQLESLAEQPNVTIQVMPFAVVRHPGLEGPLRVMEFMDSEAIWYTEAWSSGRLADTKDEVMPAMANFDLIRGSALSPEQSIEFIAQVRESHYE